MTFELKFENGKPLGTIYRYKIGTVETETFMGMDESERAVRRLSERYKSIYPNFSEERRRTLATYLVTQVPIEHKNEPLLLICAVVDHKHRGKPLTKEQFEEEWELNGQKILGTSDVKDEELIVYQITFKRYLDYVNKYTNPEGVRVIESDEPMGSKINPFDEE